MKEKEPKDAIVLLTVDTVKIKEEPTDSCVLFSDNMGDPKEKPGHSKEYITTVDKGKKITWEGVSTNGIDTINITLVSKKKKGGGSDILEEITLGDPLTDPTVVAKIKNKDFKEPENYNISFIINKKEKEIYTLDPKLQIRKSGDLD
jgi:hypothetical protein